VQHVLCVCTRVCVGSEEGGFGRHLNNGHPLKLGKDKNRGS
jgi:hypothetical protein